MPENWSPSYNTFYNRYLFKTMDDERERMLRIREALEKFEAKKTEPITQGEGRVLRVSNTERVIVTETETEETPMTAETHPSRNKNSLGFYIPEITDSFIGIIIKERSGEKHKVTREDEDTFWVSRIRDDGSEGSETQLTKYNGISNMISDKLQVIASPLKKRIYPPKPPKPFVDKEAIQRAKRYKGKYPMCVTTSYGAEPTYCQDMPVYESFTRNPDDSRKNEYWDGLLKRVNEYFLSNKNLMLKHDWRNHIHIDPGVVEVSTPVYNEFDKYVEDYISFEKEMKSAGFISSSIYYLYSEGMCHQNFGLRELKEKLRNEKYQQFCANLLHFVQQHPSICWTFLGPYDNHNAVIKGCTDGGNDVFVEFENSKREVAYRCLNFKDYDDDNCYERPSGFHTASRLELRFFMMPRNEKEMVCQYYFASCLLNYIFDITKKGKKIEFKKDLNYKDYTYESAVDEITKVCHEIGFEFQDIVEVGKLEILQERINLGETHMN